MPLPVLTQGTGKIHYMGTFTGGDNGALIVQNLFSTVNFCASVI